MNKKQQQAIDECGKVPETCYECDSEDFTEYEVEHTEPTKEPRNLCDKHKKEYEGKKNINVIRKL